MLYYLIFISTTTTIMMVVTNLRNMVITTKIADFLHLHILFFSRYNRQFCWCVGRRRKVQLLMLPWLLLFKIPSGTRFCVSNTHVQYHMRHYQQIHNHACEIAIFVLAYANVYSTNILHRTFFLDHMNNDNRSYFRMDN